MVGVWEREKVREKEQKVSLSEKRNCEAKRHREMEKIQNNMLGCIIVYRVLEIQY